jgi:hypothetical protein
VRRRRGFVSDRKGERWMIQPHSLRWLVWKVVTCYRVGLVGVYKLTSSLQGVCFMAKLSAVEWTALLRRSVPSDLPSSV